MSLALPFGLKLVNPVPVDAYYYSTGGTPYTSVGQVNAQVLSVIRYRGLTVNINNVEYWYKDGITDPDLIIKSGGSAFDITGYTATTEIRLQIIESDISNLQASASTIVSLINDVESDILYLSGVTDSKQNQLSAGIGISASNLALDTVSVELSGYTAPSSINITISGGTADFKVFDNSTVKRGIEYGGNYHSTYSNRSVVDKEYVDALAGGLSAKNAVILASTIADGNLPVTGVTQLLLSGGTLDGIAVPNGARVLIKNQSSPANDSQNGIYTYNAGNGFLTRALDFDQVGEISSGSFTTVVSGLTQSNTVWIVTSANVAVVNTDPIVWSLFALPIAGIADIQNVGGGVGVLSGITGNVANLRSLTAGVGLTITEDGDEILFEALASGTGERLEKEFNQSGHTFSVGDVIEYSGSTFIKALAVIDRNSEIIGFVSEVIDANNFKVVLSGYIDGISGLTLNPSTTYYLSDNIAGGLTSTAPTDQDTINKPILTTLTADDAIIFHYRAIINTTGVTSSETSGFTSAVNIGTGTGLVYDDTQSGNTLNFRTLSGGTGVSIVTSGDTILFNASSSNVATNKIIITGNTTLDATNYIIFCNTTGGTITITLPASPVDGQIYKIKDVGNAFINNITISGNGNNIDGNTDVFINTERGGFEMIFDSLLDEWMILNFVG